MLLRDGEHALSDVSQRTGVALPIVTREVDRLAAASILTSRKIGRTRVVAANPIYPFINPLTEIIAGTYGPSALIHDAFADLEGLQHLVVFGSWAARLSGKQGPAPGDVDVLVVGPVSKMETYGIADDLTRAVGRPVNVTIMASERWDSDADPFVVSIKDSPTIELV